MALTEKEVQELADQVGEIDMADPVVQNMLLNSIRETETQLKQQKASFRVMQLMRNDERMKAIATDVENSKKLLETLKGLIVTG